MAQVGDNRKYLKTILDFVWLLSYHLRSSGFRDLWRNYDHGQHSILKERVYKPILQVTSNPILVRGPKFRFSWSLHERQSVTKGFFSIFDPIKATATAFILVAYWHAPLPYQEEDYDNWNSIYAYIVFGLGNFLFTFLENIVSFKIFSIAPMKIVGFLFIYLVNFFFITSSFNSGILLLKRVLLSWPSVFDIFGVFMFCFLAIKALDKASNGNEIV